MTDSHLSSTPIPYQSAHDGPRRVLALRLRRGMVAASAVHVNIDGASHAVSWGSAALEIPADRPVNVGVYQILRGTVGVANVVLSPEAPAELEYRGPAHPSQAGEIGSPGTVRSRGKVIQFVLFGCIGLLFLVLLVFVLALGTG